MVRRRRKRVWVSPTTRGAGTATSRRCSRYGFASALVGGSEWRRVRPAVRRRGHVARGRFTNSHETPVTAHAQREPRPRTTLNTHANKRPPPPRQPCQRPRETTPAPSPRTQPYSQPHTTRVRAALPTTPSTYAHTQQNIYTPRVRTRTTEEQREETGQLKAPRHVPRNANQTLNTHLPTPP